MPHPFEMDANYINEHIEAMVDITFADIQSQFLLLPRGSGFVDYPDFQDAYELLKRHTSAFANLNESAVWSALREDALVLLVLRTILGFTPPEWADLARSERGSDVSQGYARGLDGEVRRNRHVFETLTLPRDSVKLARTEALVGVALDLLQNGAAGGGINTVHRLAKVDTAEGIVSLRHIAMFDVPYAVLLYERYLGRPFASHRDSVSELVGDVMESAIEDRLARAGISFRKTRRAERVPGFEQAPDFFIPDEFNPSIVIEAKITGDDGTARDKATRIVTLAEMSERRGRDGLGTFQVVACIDGRGFGVRREDMRRVLTRTGGKVFTLATLDQLIEHTQIKRFASI